MENILRNYHTLEAGSHFGAHKTSTKVFQSGFYWPTLFKDSFKVVNACE